MNGQTCACLLLVGHSIPWVLITPFGRPVEPDVNRILATVSWSTATSSMVVGSVASSSSESTIGTSPIAPMAPANPA